MPDTPTSPPQRAQETAREYEKSSCQLQIGGIISPFIPWRTTPLPRPKSLIPTRKIKVDIPIDLLEQVDGRLFDPVVGDAGYGQRRALIIRLLTEWVAKTPIHPSVEKSIEEAGNKSPRLEALLAMMPRS